jgi:hypothetical protein
LSQLLLELHLHGLHVLASFNVLKVSSFGYLLIFLNCQPSPFLLRVFSSVNKRDWVSFIPQSPSLVSSSLSHYCPFLCILS